MDIVKDIISVGRRHQPVHIVSPSCHGTGYPPRNPVRDFDTVRTGNEICRPLGRVQDKVIRTCGKRYGCRPSVSIQGYRSIEGDVRTCLRSSGRESESAVASVPEHVAVSEFQNGIFRQFKTFVDIIFLSFSFCRCHRKVFTRLPSRKRARESPIYVARSVRTCRTDVNVAEFRIEIDVIFIGTADIKIAAAVRHEDCRHVGLSVGRRYLRIFGSSEIGRIVIGVQPVVVIPYLEHFTCRQGNVPAYIVVSVENHCKIRLRLFISDRVAPVVHFTHDTPCMAGRIGNLLFLIDFLAVIFSIELVCPLIRIVEVHVYPEIAGCRRYRVFGIKDTGSRRAEDSTTGAVHEGEIEGSVHKGGIKIEFLIQRAEEHGLFFADSVSVNHQSVESILSRKLKSGGIVCQAVITLRIDVGNVPSVVHKSDFLCLGIRHFRSDTPVSGGVVPVGRSGELETYVIRGTTVVFGSVFTEIDYTFKFCIVVEAEKELRTGVIPVRIFSDNPDIRVSRFGINDTHREFHR